MNVPLLRRRRGTTVGDRSAWMEALTRGISGLSGPAVQPPGPHPHHTFDPHHPHDASSLLPEQRDGGPD